MNYERGLRRLHRQLSKIDHPDLKADLIGLEQQLHQAVLQQAPDHDFKMSPVYYATLEELDKISYRTLGMSFDAVCNHRWLGLCLVSLRSLLVVLFTLLVLPSIGIAIAYSPTHNFSELRIQEIEDSIQRTDKRIGANVTSTFFLSQANPCFEEDALAIMPRVSWTIEVSDSLAVLTTIDGEVPNNTRCVWIYRDLGSPKEMFAKDYWSFRYELLRREYYEGEELVAADTFQPTDSECFKKRYFFDVPIQPDPVCYQEDGVRFSRLTQAEHESPIPPSLYWFFYR